MRFSNIAAIAASVSSVSATATGFNYGTTKSDGTFFYQQDYENLFTTAKGLSGTNSQFTSARLYDMIQGGSSTNEPTQAIPAALKTKTSLLLGLWATDANPGDSGPFNAQITALKTALGQWPGWTDLVVGISVGSEDLYRSSGLGKAASAGLGESTTTILSRINQVKEALKGTALEKAPIGHVDTWTAWTGWPEQGNSPPTDIINAVDFIGLDAYPYFENTLVNPIENGTFLFTDAIARTQQVAGGKPIWVTETGWPVSGKTENLGVPSLDNAQTYWNNVGCPQFGNVNIWWYTLQDAAPTTPNPSFGVVGSTLSTTPLYDLSCKNGSKVLSASSSASASASASATASSGASSSGASTLATSIAVASSGTPLSPTKGGGLGVGGSNSSVATGTGAIIPTATGGSGNNVSTSAGSSGPAKTSSPAGTTGTSSGASFMSASFVVAVGAVFAAVLAL